MWELTWLHTKNIAPTLQSKVFQEHDLEQLLQQKQIETDEDLEHDAYVFVPSNETLGQDGSDIDQFFL